MESSIVILLKKAWGPHRFNGEKSTWSCSYFLDLSRNTQISRELHVWKFDLFSWVQLRKVCFLLFFSYISDYLLQIVCHQKGPSVFLWENTLGKPPQKSSRNLKASSTRSGSPRKSLVFHDNGATKVCIVFNMFTKHPCNLYSIVEIFTSTCMINSCAHNFLFQEKTTSNPTWNQTEMCGLVQFIALYFEPGGKKVWPVHKDMDFWEKCAKAVSEYSGLHQRSGQYKTMH